MYAFLEKSSFKGLEIAPTRMWGENPYACVKEAKEYRKRMLEMYDLQISSMQSIWYGRTEQIFGSYEERQKLIDYTKSAFEFADALGCGNLVFGCPKNRNAVSVSSADVEFIAEEFFGNLAQLAMENNTVLSLEANPPSYHTNFINNTEDAVVLIKKIRSKGLQLNYDLGTVIQNNEKIQDTEIYIEYINHVHISEPGLAPVEMGTMQKQLCLSLEALQYSNFVSIEMRNLNNIMKVQEICTNLKTIVRGQPYEVG